MNNVIDIRRAPARMLMRRRKLNFITVQPIVPALRRAPLVMTWARDPTSGTLVANWSTAINDADKARSRTAPFFQSRRTLPHRRERTRYGRRV